MNKKKPQTLKPKKAPSKEVQEKASSFYAEMELKAAEARSQPDKKTRSNAKGK